MSLGVVQLAMVFTMMVEAVAQIDHGEIDPDLRIKAA